MSSSVPLLHPSLSWHSAVLLRRFLLPESVREEKVALQTDSLAVLEIRVKHLLPCSFLLSFSETCLRDEERSAVLEAADIYTHARGANKK